MRLFFLGLVVGLVGCQHTHLRHNTVHQAKTLAEIYEQQVLDNLAKTVHDAHALPYFAYPKDGSTNISQEANITATPFHNFTNVFGINGKRSGLEQWGLTPVSDPAKLQLMQCAYQRAVYGHPMSECSECCEREKEFEGKPDVKLKVWGKKEPEGKSDLLLNGGEGKGQIIGALCNPATGKLYNVQPSGTGHVYIDDDGNSYIVDEAGYVTMPQYDCDGPCAVNCGWLSYGKRCDVPRDCCSLIGYHCGTYVWVPQCHRQHLSRLTLKILDYAVNDPPVVLQRQKEVKVSVDKFGRFTTKDCEKVGTVKAVIAIDDPISSVLVVDNCALRKDTKDQLINAGFSEGEAEDLLDKLKDQSFASTTESLTTDSGVTKTLTDQQSKSVANYLDASGGSAPVDPSPYVIPKRPTYHPGDSYLNPFRIQRELNALGTLP